MNATLTQLREHRAQEKLAREVKLRKAFGLAYYNPHPKQAAFHSAGEYKGRYLRTGNRFGKSDCGAAEDCAWLLGARVWLDPSDPNYTAGIPSHPVKGLLICTDWDKAEEIFTATDGRKGKLFNFLPADHVKFHKNHSGKVDQIWVKRLDGETSTLHIDTVQSFKQNPMGAESSDWDFIHVDEPIPQRFWNAVSRGLSDRDGKYWFTCTPITEMWINDWFLPPSKIRATFDRPYIFKKEEYETWMVTGSSFDNPYINHKAHRGYLAGLTAAERAAREEGIPTALSGMIYRQFDPDKHVLQVEKPYGWSDWLTPPPDWTIRVAIDPHPKTSTAILFAATSPNNETIFYHELWDGERATRTLAAFIDEMLEILQGRQPACYLCDPSAWNPIQALGGISMADEFFKRAVPIQKASKQLSFGILKVQQCLLNASWHFSPNLHETLYEFDHYAWSETSEKPIDKRDHMMECLYRLAVHGLHHIDLSNSPEPVTPTNFRKFSPTTLATSRRELRRNFTTSRKPSMAQRYPA